MPRRIARSLARRKPDIAAVLALLCFCLLFFWPVVFGNRVFAPIDGLVDYYPWKATAPEGAKIHNPLVLDGSLQFMPWRIYTRQSLLRGEVPLWNPFSFCGQPFLANGQSALLYPPGVLVNLLFEPGRAVGVEACLHMFLAGLFAYMLLRKMRLSRFGSWFAALAFMMNGWLIGWMQIPSHFRSAVWLPLILLCFELAATRRRMGFAALGGAASAMSFLAGQAQIAAYLLVGLFGYAALRVWQERNDWKPQIAPATAAKVCLAIALAGVCLAAAQLLPLQQIASLSHRHVIKPSFFGLFFPGLKPENLVRFLMPDFLGNPVDYTMPQWTNYTEFTAYIGVVPLALALLSFRKKQGALGLCLMAAAILMALGTPLYAPVYYLAPSMKKVVVHRILGLAALFSPLAVAAGWDAVMRPGWRLGGKTAFAAAGAAAALAAGFWIEVQIAHGMGFGEMIRMGGVPLLKFALLTAAILLAMAFKDRIEGPLFPLAVLVLMLIDLAPFAHRYNTMAARDYMYPSAPLIKFLKSGSLPHRYHASGKDWILTHSLSAAYGLYSIEGYESLYPKRYSDLLQATDEASGMPFVGGGVPHMATFNSPVLDMMNVKYLVTKTINPGEGYSVAYDGEAVAFLNERALPRAFIADRWEVLPEGEILKRITSPDYKPNEVVYLEQEPPRVVSSRILKGTDEKPPEASRVKIDRIDPNRASMQVEAAKESVLFYSDSFYPGWKARVDGAPAKPLRANYGFKAIHVFPGRHRVEFIFSPGQCRWGLGISLIATLLALKSAIGCLKGLRQPRRARP